VNADDEAMIVAMAKVQKKLSFMTATVCHKDETDGKKQLKIYSYHELERRSITIM
jgi:hypothetical protein